MSQMYSVTKENGRLIYKDAAEKVEAAIPDGIEFAGLATVKEPETADVDAVVSASLAAPIGSPRLAEMAKGKKSAVILVSDATRAVLTARVLPHVVSELRQGGLSLERMLLIVAIGVHRDATEEEMRAISGEFAGKIRIVNHDPYGPDSLVEVGTTSRGNRIEVNRLVRQSDLRISIGKVETHEFAGYSGSRKSILPGVASERTILWNHSPEMIADPKAAPGILAGNPIHEDMIEAARMCGLDFCINLIQNATGTPIAAFSGAMETSHAAAVKYYADHYRAELAAGSNIYLITPGYPLNIDLYQSMKPLFGLYSALKKNDVVILYSRCREGVNSDDMLKPFDHGSNPDEIMQYLIANYRVQMDHSLLFCKVLQKGVRVIALSEGVEPAVFEKMRMTPARSVEHALELAKAMKIKDGETPKLGIVPMAQRMIIG